MIGRLTILVLVERESRLFAKHSCSFHDGRARSKNRKGAPRSCSTSHSVTLQFSYKRSL